MANGISGQHQHQNQNQHEPQQQRRLRLRVVSGTKNDGSFGRRDRRDNCGWRRRGISSAVAKHAGSSGDSLTESTAEAVAP